MTRPLGAVLVASAAAVAATLLLTACGTRHTGVTALSPPAAEAPQGTSLSADAATLPGATPATTPATTPTTTRTTTTTTGAPTAASIPGTTAVAPAAGSSPTDLGSIRSDLTGAANAAGAANQHLSSGAAAASQSDAP